MYVHVEDDPSGFDSKAVAKIDINFDFNACSNSKRHIASVCVCVSHAHCQP